LEDCDRRVELGDQAGEHHQLAGLEAARKYFSAPQDPHDDLPDAKGEVDAGVEHRLQTVRVDAGVVELARLEPELASLRLLLPEHLHHLDARDGVAQDRAHVGQAAPHRAVLVAYLRAEGARAPGQRHGGNQRHQGELRVLEEEDDADDRDLEQVDGHVAQALDDEFLHHVDIVGDAAHDLAGALVVVERERELLQVLV